MSRFPTWDAVANGEPIRVMAPRVREAAIEAAKWWWGDGDGETCRVQVLTLDGWQVFMVRRFMTYDVEPER